MRKAIIPALLLVLVSVVLGATVFREQVAHAASAVLQVREQNLDANGNIKVHEQGTASVNVTNSSVTAVPGAATRTEQHNLLAETGGEDSVSFAVIHASLITITGIQGSSSGELRLDGPVGGLDFPFPAGGSEVGNDIVLPLSQTLALTSVHLTCEFICSAQINIVGT